jgi:cell wall-associated NlpC family hydrolase/D-alanyl-D-alanine dipeptidase
MKSKTGVAGIIIGIIFFIIALAVLILPRITQPAEFSDAIGEQQYELLRSAKEAQALQQYFLLSFDYSATDAVANLLSNSGYYLESSDDGSRASYPCGRYFGAIFSGSQGCVPNYLSNYESFVFEEFQSYTQAYPLTQANVPFTLSFLPQNEATKIFGRSTRNVEFPIRNERETEVTATSVNTYTPGLLGGYGAEEPISCATGECVAQVAQYFYNQYTTSGTTLPYVWGGESPYTYEDTLTLANTPNSFFTGVSVTPSQPGKAQATVPGFDCSGWLWWIGKHAGIPGYSVRKTAQSYWNDAVDSSQTQLICGGATPCYRQTIEELAQPGDVLFHGTGNTIGHIALYVGNGEIIHSRGSRGLIKEIIPTFYASADTTKIVSVYRYNLASNGVQSLEGYAESTAPQINSTLIGPAVWCEGSTASVSPTYQNRIMTAASGVSGTLQDIAIQAGLEKNIDPALIATHMQWESQMGQANSCTAVGKSSLTGCGWYPSCSAGCSCENGFVLNDLTQVQCTASTDLNAFTEALTGQTDLSPGLYSECNQYANNPDTMWTCMLCIYQGNYASDVTGTGEAYFLDGGQSCPYAESFRSSYCGWRNYFADQGYAVSNSYSATPYRLGATNYLSVAPYVDTTVDVSFAALQELNTFVQETSEMCTTNLSSCLHSQIASFTAPGITIQEQSFTDPLAMNVVEQLLDCDANGQDSCYCVIQPDLNLASQYEDMIIHIEDDGAIHVGENTLGGFFPNQGNKIYQSDLNLSVAFTDDPLENDYVQFYIDKEENEYYFEAEDWFDDTTWELDETTPAMLLQKLQGDYIWRSPTSDISSRDICMDRKQHFPLEAKLSTQEVPLQFTLELTDTQGPELNLWFVDQLACLGQPNILVQFSVPITEEKELGYTITLNGNIEERFFFYATEAVLLNETTADPRAGTLYKSVSEDSEMYYVFLSHLPNEQNFVANTQYTVQVTAYDHFMNAQDSDLQSITLAVPVGDASYPVLDTEHEFIAQHFVDASICSPGSYVLVGTPLQLQASTIMFPENEIDGQSYLNILSGNQGSQGVLDFIAEPYIVDGVQLTDSIHNEPVYTFAGIPNVYCTEEGSEYRRICGASFELVNQLYLLSVNTLQPDNYQLVIQQAFRDYDIQNYFWEKFVISGYNPQFEACNPNPEGQGGCRHMLSGAIDVSVRDLDTNQFVSNTLREAIMCEQGFVRYSGEQWHYEYGTARWDAAEALRADGVDVCAI